MKRTAQVKEEGVKSENKKFEKRIKNFIKNHNPQVIKNRNDYSSQESVIQRRRELNKLRRWCASILMNYLRNNKLIDEKGNYYYIQHNKFIKESSDGKVKEIIKCDKKGNIETHAFNTELDLLNIDLNTIFPSNDNKEDLYEAVSRLLEGDPDMENVVKKKKKIIDTELDEDDCYWKKFSEEEKKEFLDQIKIKS